VVTRGAINVRGSSVRVCDEGASCFSGRHPEHRVQRFLFQCLPGGRAICDNLEGSIAGAFECSCGQELGFLLDDLVRRGRVVSEAVNVGYVCRSGLWDEGLSEGIGDAYAILGTTLG
jgi:hypothetical protein